MNVNKNIHNKIQNNMNINKKTYYYEYEAENSYKI